MKAKKKPKSRPRAKGIARIKQRGEYGPSMAALEKTIEKLIEKATSQVERKRGLGFSSKAFELLGKKRWRQDYRIAVSSALNAIGLDPKNAASKRIRGAVHKSMQRYSDLLYDTKRNLKQGETQKCITE